VYAAQFVTTSGAAETAFGRARGLGIDTGSIPGRRKRSSVPSGPRRAAHALPAASQQLGFQSFERSQRVGLPRGVPGSPTAGTRFETPPKSRMLRHGCGPARRTGRRRNRARARSSTGDVAAYSARPERARMEHRSAAELGCPSASPMSTEPPWSPTPGQTTDRSARFRAWLRQARAAQKSWSMYPSSNSANLPLSEMGSPSGPITTRPTC